MERYEIGNDERPAAMVAAAERAKAVFARHGGAVASFSPKAPSNRRDRNDRVTRARENFERLGAAHTALPPGWRGTDAARLVRRMRDMDER